MAKKEQIIEKQERQIQELANDKKVLEDSLKKYEKEIEKLMEQQSQDKPKKEPDATKSPCKELPQVKRYE